MNTLLTPDFFKKDTELTLEEKLLDKKKKELVNKQLMEYSNYFRDQDMSKFPTWDWDIDDCRGFGVMMLRMIRPKKEEEKVRFEIDELDEVDDSEETIFDFWVVPSDQELHFIRSTESFMNSKLNNACHWGRLDDDEIDCRKGPPQRLSTYREGF